MWSLASVCRIYEFADKIVIFAVLKRRLLQWRETEDSFCFYSYTVRSLLSQYIMPVNYNDCEASLLTYWEKATELCRWYWRSRPRPTAIVPPITLKISNEIALGIRPYGWLYTQTPNCYSLRGSDTTPLYRSRKTSADRELLFHANFFLDRVSCRSCAGRNGLPHFGFYETSFTDQRKICYARVDRAHSFTPNFISTGALRCSWGARNWKFDSIFQFNFL